MKTARFIRNIRGWTGDARLYQLSPLLEGEAFDENESPECYEYVIVSAAVGDYSGPETYIFPADADGNCLSFGELPGSYRGGLSHERALNGAGYSVA